MSQISFYPPSIYGYFFPVPTHNALSNTSPWFVKAKSKKSETVNFRFDYKSPAYTTTGVLKGLIKGGLILGGGGRDENYFKTSYIAELINILFENKFRSLKSRIHFKTCSGEGLIFWKAYNQNRWAYNLGGGGGGSLKEKQIPNKEIEKDYKLIKLQQPGIHTYFGFELPSWFWKA